MRFIKTAIPDVLVIQPEVYKDSRGFFLESFKKNEFAEHGIREDFVQDNHSMSSKGVLRGLHYQSAPMEQAKIVRVVRGEVFDVAVDLRPKSTTYGQSVSRILTASSKEMLYVPAGFAHGFLTLSDEAEFIYKVSNYYSPIHDKGVRWDDPDLAVAWPKLDAPYILSKKDQNFPGFKELKNK